MARDIPWGNVEELAKHLERQRDALTTQINSLRASQDLHTPDGRATAILCEYLLTGSSTDASWWARDMGWKAISRKTGAPCEYSAAEVVALIEDDSSSVSPELRALCRRLLRRQRASAGK